MKEATKHPLIDQYQTPILQKLGLSTKEPLIIAGPCAVENERDLLMTAQKLQSLGIHYMRAGAFKPRTSCYDFQGLGLEGLQVLKRIKEQTGMKIVTEIPSAELLPHFINIADILQIGARNMQNFYLLQAVGKTKIPVILKRGFGNTVEEWLCAAEYILIAGNPNVILCERGIKTFETSTRNTLDISSVPIIKQLSNIPVLIDPSHAAGRKDIVPALALAGLAVGAAGLLIEVHTQPDCAWTDAKQAISLEELELLLKNIKSKPF